MKIKITINNPLKDINPEEIKQKIDKFIDELICPEIIISGRGIKNNNRYFIHDKRRRD